MRKLFLILIAVLALFSFGCTKKAESEQPAAAAVPAFSPTDFVRAYIADLAKGNNIVGFDTFVSDVKAGKDMYIVDIRSAADYEKGHVKGAVNMPWGTSAMWEQVPYLPTDRTVYVHCYSGQTAGQAIVLMKMAGVQAVSVNSGWNLGISKEPDFQSIVSTVPTAMDTTSRNSASAEVLGIIQKYYEDMAKLVGTTFANNMVTEENAKAILDAADPGVQFVSMRRPADFAAGHIATAINVPFGDVMWDGIGLLPSDKKLITYCYSGQTANQGVALLRLLGYDAVSLHFGMGTARTAPRGWVNKGFPTVTN